MSNKPRIKVPNYKQNELEAAQPTVKVVEGPIGELPPELVPVYECYQKKGREVLLGAAILLLAFIAFLAYRNYSQRQNARASAGLNSATSVEDLENLNAQYGKTKVGSMIRLRLAKAYYDAGNYADAAQAFQDYARHNAKGEFAPVARLGYATSLEAQRDFDAALAAYEGVTDDATSPAAVQALLGKARCLAAKGDKPAALDLIDRVAIDKKDTLWEGEAEKLRGVVERFTELKDVSSFNLLDSSVFQQPSAEGGEEAAAPVKDDAAEEAAAPAKDGAAEEAAAPVKDDAAEKAAAPVKDGAAEEAAAPAKEVTPAAK